MINGKMFNQKITNPKYLSVGLILIIVLTVFYPVLSAGVIDLDDTSMIMDLNIYDQNISLKKLFFPETPVAYFRPLLTISYIVDSKIWEMEYSGYHLTNIIFHLLNSIILYFIVLNFFKGFNQNTVVPIFTTLLFAVHPLTCESVAWISGRSDILAAFFSLLAFWVYQSSSKFRYFGVMLCLFLGLLSKESALVVCPLIIMYEYLAGSPGKISKEKLIQTARWIFWLSIPVIIYLYERTSGFDIFGTTMEISSAAGSNVGSEVPGKQLSFLFKTPAIIAFYFKKLIIPYPLNFAIYTLNYSVYTLLFFWGAIGCTGLILKKKFYLPSLTLFIFISFSPALLLAWADVAWTPYAERYLYLSIPVLAIGTGRLYCTNTLIIKNWNKVALTCFCIIIFMFSATTFHRNLIWNKKEKLWADTYNKNPDFPRVLYKYGHALGLERGIPYIKKAVEIGDKKNWLDLSLLDLADYSIKNKNYSAAAEYAKRAVTTVPNPTNYIEASRMVTHVIDKFKGGREENIRFVIYCSKQLYAIRHNPNYLFKIAVMYTKLNDYKSAEAFYEKIIVTHPKSRIIKQVQIKLQSINELINVSKT